MSWFYQNYGWCLSKRLLFRLLKIWYLRFLNNMSFFLFIMWCMRQGETMSLLSLIIFWPFSNNICIIFFLLCFLITVLMIICPFYLLVWFLGQYIFLFIFFVVYCHDGKFSNKSVETEYEVAAGSPSTGILPFHE